MSANPVYPPVTQPALYLVFASASLPTLTESALAERLSHPDITGNEAIALTWTRQDPHSCLGSAQLGQHSLQVSGLAMPLPRDLVDQTVMVSPWGPQTKAAMRQHRAHLSLVYNGNDPDPVAQMVSLYRLAAAFENEDLLGIVNANAWTAHPPADFLSPQNLSRYLQEIPFNLWIGYVRFYTDADHYWLVTKGHHIFDVPDLAYRVQPEDDPDAVIALFINVFYYLYEQDVYVTAGDSFEISSSGQQLLFSEVTELVDVLMGPAGTLVIQEK
jgi:hypothetical protein